MEPASARASSPAFPRRSDIYLIGLTGNIAVGKSTVDNMLAAKGAIIIDGDELVHQLQRKGQPVWRRIVDHFGSDILGPDGELDRPKLASIVFSSPEQLRALESMVHPAVAEETRGLIAAAPAGSVVVYDAIKLIESSFAASCDSVWVVTAPIEAQEVRLVRQRGLSPEAARQRIAAQAPQEEKIRRADVVIDNGGSLEETRRQIDAAWEGLQRARSS